MFSGKRAHTLEDFTVDSEKGRNTAYRVCGTSCISTWLNFQKVYCYEISFHCKRARQIDGSSHFKPSVWRDWIYMWTCAGAVMHDTIFTVPSPPKSIKWYWWECVRVCVGWGEGREVKLGEGSGGCNCFSQLTHSTQSERIIYGLYGVVFTASTCKWWCIFCVLAWFNDDSIPCLCWELWYEFKADILDSENQAPVFLEPWFCDGWLKN